MRFYDKRRFSEQNDNFDDWHTPAIHPRIKILPSDSRLKATETGQIAAHKQPDPPSASQLKLRKTKRSPVFTDLP